MGSRNIMEKLKKPARQVKRGYRKVKSHMKGRGSQSSSRAESLTSTNASVSHHNSVLSQPIAHEIPLASAVGSASHERTHPLYVSAPSSVIQKDGSLGEPSHDATSQTGYNNNNASCASRSSLVTPLEGKEESTGAITGSQHGNGPEELSGPTQLWAAAYKMLEKDDPELLDAYQRVLLSKEHSNCNQPQTDGGDWQTQIQRLACERLEANQKERLSFQLREKNVVFREQLERVLVFIVSIKDVVGAAISSEPHAALGWAGAMFVFPIIDFYYNIYKYQISIIVHFNHSTLIKLWKDFRVRDDWKGKADQFRAIESEIESVIKVLSAHKTNEIDKKLQHFWSETQSSLGEYKKIMRESLEEIKRASDLKDLPVAHYAAFESSESGRQCCTSGTQSKTLSHVQDWLENPAGKPIMWLHGMAGTGKSTISQTIATALDKKTGFTDNSQLTDGIYLGGTFFFKQDDISRNSANVLFTTLAHQLAYKPFGLGNEIANAIKNNASPNIGVKSLKLQWEELIFKPLQMIQNSLPRTRLILVIDALDECQHRETGTMRANIRDILQSLAQLGELSEIQARVLVTSRNESHIYTAFEQLKDSYDELELSKVTLDGSDNDIAIFMKNELYRNEKCNSSGLQWPSPVDFDKLVQKSGGLFIYAATACKFLSVNDKTLAKNRLRTLLGGTPNSMSPESNLDDIYRTVLNASTRDWAREEKEANYLRKETLRLIAALFKPLPITSLVEFAITKSQASEVVECLESVRSIVNIPEDHKLPVSLVHLSFREFLLDEKRCKGTGLFVDPSTMHIHLFQRCLKIMSQQLHMDMCKLRKPGILSVEVPPGSVQKFISPHLQYACTYWVDHLLLIKEAHLPQDILTSNGKIYNFLKTHILNWLEVLSLIGEIGSAVHTMNHLRTLVNPLTGWITMLPCVDKTWSAELLSIDMREDGQIGSIDVSPDGKTVVSVSGSVVRLWEAATGIETTKIYFRPNCDIRGASFSPDGKYIALLITAGVRLYDRETSETSDLPCGHANELAFPRSPGSNLFASINLRTCSVWDMSTKKCIRTLQTTHRYCPEVAISPRNLVALGSSSYSFSPGSKLQVWDINTGELATEIDYDNSTDEIYSIAFSPDGKTMAVAILTSVKIYNTETWYLRFTLYGCKPKSVAFSSAGDFLMVHYQIGEICLHDLDSGELIRKVDIEAGFLNVTFFPDGKTLASRSRERLRLWDLTTTNETRSTTYDKIRWIHPLPDKNTVMISRGGGTTVWNLKEFKCIRVDPYELEPSSNDRFALYRSDSSIDIRCTTTGNHIKRFADVKHIQFSPHGEILTLVSHNAIRILEVDTWNERASFPLKKGYVPRCVDFSTNNKVICFSMLQERAIWLKNLFQLVILQTHGISLPIEYYYKSDPILSPDGNLVAYFPKEASKYINLLEVDTQKVRAKMRGGVSAMDQILLSPDSTLVAGCYKTDDNAHQITLWSTTHGEVIDTLRRVQRLEAVTIISSGKVVFTQPEGLSIWDPKRNEVIRLAASPCRDVTFIEDGGYLVNRYGRLPLPSTAKDFNCIYVDNDWVLQGGERLLWIPEAYRFEDLGNPPVTLVQGEAIVLTHTSGPPAFIRIDLQNTPLAKQSKEYSQVKQVNAGVTEVL
ncbi:hypothetical protein Daesc_003994 [Daldinia eschscholtzii]|uniref:Mitochondrial division protein 1 n=1 Tax=Daldinia eschscholtzii TaxID=292717 RepID=A0AAX6MPD2_9PEZI